MKPLFNKQSGLQARVLFATVVATVLIVTNGCFTGMATLRSFLDNMVFTPLYYTVHLPKRLFNNVYRYCMEQQQLLQENDKLRRELLLKNSDCLRLEYLLKENHHLQALLDVAKQRDEQKLVAKVLSLDLNGYRQQLIINKGTLQGVSVGQSVLNDQGIIGQVVVASAHCSRVLLIWDATHAIPVQLLRNGTRMIAYGTGNNMEMQLELLPVTCDIQLNDLLVASGLGDRFPAGYPVATVTSVVVDTQRGHTIVKVRPTVTLADLHCLLLLGSNHVDSLQRHSPTSHRALLSGTVGLQ